MAASKRWLAVALILVAVLASLEYMPRNVVFRAAIPADAAFPLNEGPTGTSILWARLAEEGYDEAVVYGSSGIARAANKTDIVYLLVAPGPASPDAPGEPLDTLRILVSSGKRVHVILLDENPEYQAWRFVAEASQAICGAPPPGHSGVLNNSVATVVAVLEGAEWRLSTGFTGALNPELPNPQSVGVEARAYTAQPALPMRLGAYEYFAAAWPAPLPEGDWVLVGARCTSTTGSVTILADGTVAVNLAAVQAPRDIDFVVELVKSAAPDPQDTVIVVDESFYSGPAEPGDEVNLILRLHPTVLVLAFAHAYSTIEKAVAAEFEAQRLYWLILLAAGLVLVSATWLSTPASDRVSLAPKEKRRGRRGLPRPGILGSWRDARDACRLASRARALVPAPARPSTPIEERIAFHAARITRVCRLVAGAPAPARYIPLWGWAARAARESALALLAAAGVPLKEAGGVGVVGER